MGLSQSSGCLLVCVISQTRKVLYLFTRATVILLAGLPFAPESPWYYVRKGQIEQASKCLKKLYPSSSDINAKLAMIIRTVEEDTLVHA